MIGGGTISGAAPAGQQGREGKKGAKGLHAFAPQAFNQNDSTGGDAADLTALRARFNSSRSSFLRVLATVQREPKTKGGAA